MKSASSTFVTGDVYSRLLANCTTGETAFRQDCAYVFNFCL
jgi:hypothetical protein